MSEVDKKILRIFFREIFIGFSSLLTVPKDRPDRYAFLSESAF